MKTWHRNFNKLDLKVSFSFQFEQKNILIKILKISFVKIWTIWKRLLVLIILKS